MSEERANAKDAVLAAWREQLDMFLRQLPAIPVEELERYRVGVGGIDKRLDALIAEWKTTPVTPAATPVPMLLWCPSCCARHIDVGEFSTKPHHTHACQSCGMVWRPALVPTTGVQFLPGFKNEVVP